MVYIECNTPGSKARLGTGVIVSKAGHVLTARHVLTANPSEPIPNDLECFGKEKVASGKPTEKLIIQPAVAPVDAALLQFSEDKVRPFIGFCKVEPWMVRRKIFVAGFPGGTRTGVPSFREGVLSTTKGTPNGVLETDGQTIAGMSGGPVFSGNLAGLVGIVVGASFASNGSVDYYGILPAAVYAETFGLVESDTPCYHEQREVDMTAVPTWTSGSEPVKLGVPSNQGVCFLARVKGQFNQSEDAISVEIVDGEYILQGNDSSGQIEASARCIWYD
ncbi:MAG: trypsin-like peptidase domain-containing protein [Mesorhizobium sp.]|uniref:S1 family peptidase n=1 Tax=Mesorhizobium sp. TaxID=1871066 RepID=UPI001219A921|nr:serine protease [Mesorhizobium sp.]TIM15513.1 MAG: trypsin-like peptidase domain-containing protein [Mesorhizobium sp.]